MVKRKNVALLFLIILILSLAPSLAYAQSVVDNTVTIASAIYYSGQKQTFYASGRYWVFYSNATNGVIRLKTSTDGSSWSSSTDICNPLSGLAMNFDIHFNGTYLHYVIRSDATTLKYRRGIPNANGTITWSASEQTAASGSGDKEKPVITVDSSGYPFIGYYYDGGAGSRYAYVTKSSLNNGSWSTEAGHPYNAGSTSSEEWEVLLVSTSNRVYAISQKDEDAGTPAIDCDYYQGGSWTDEGSPSNLVIEEGMYSCVTTDDNDDLHYVFLESNTLDVQYVKRDNSTGWGSDELVQSAESVTTALVISARESTGEVWCFWTNSDHVYYKRRTIAGIWDSSATDWISETFYEHRVSGFRSLQDRKMGYAYVAGSASPYSVKFHILDLNLAPTFNVTATTAFSIGEYGWVNVTVFDYWEVANLFNVSMYANNSYTQNFTLLWTQSTGVFSEVSDPSGICELSGSTRENLDNYTDKIAFRFRLGGSVNESSFDAEIIAFNDDMLNQTETYSELFTYAGIEWDPVGDMIDSAFSLFGILDYMETILDFVSDISSHFSESILGMVTLVNLQFQVIWATFSWFTDWATRIITAVLNLNNTIHDIIGGVADGTVNLWGYFNIVAWIDIIPLGIILYWINSMQKRARTLGTFTVLWSDLQAFINIFSFFMSAFMTVIGIIENAVFRLINAIVPG